jgi:flagellar basal-body rod protein FlgF
MSNATAISLSGLAVLERRLEAVAHNVANANSAGFKADAIRFSTHLERAGGAALAFAAQGGVRLDIAPGSIEATGNPLDLAVTGEAWFAQLHDDGIVYTRDGRVTLDAEGTLLSAEGAPLLDAGGAPMRINPQGGRASFTAEGVLMQDGRRVAALGLFNLPDNARISRAGGVAVNYDGFAEPVTDRRNLRVVPGHVEKANVSAIAEMASMITITRAFEGIANAMRAQEELHSNAIKALGPQG